MIDNPAMSRNVGWMLRGISAAALALCMGAGANAGPQDQGSAQEQGQPPATQDAKPKPSYAPQDADKPPYSHDRPQRSAQISRIEQPSPAEPNQAAPSTQSAEAGQVAPSVPGTLTLPAGTILMVRTNEFLSSDKNQVGNPFTAVLEQPVVVNGWVVARRGQTLLGRVKEAKKAGRVKGVSQLGLELTDLTIVDGQQVPILTGLWKASAGTSHGQDATTIAGGSALGAAIGAAADWGTGAAIGAGAGAVAGLAAVLLTRGYPTELPPESPLNFRVEDAVKIDTTQTQQAFLPVNQEDFNNGRGDRRRPRLVTGYPGSWGYPYGYYGPYYPYPAAYFGFYSGYGWGPRYYGGYYGRPGYRH